MDPLDFIAAVVPSAGVLCVVELSSKKKQHVFGNMEVLGRAIEQFNAAKQDTYFALASFIESGSREAANALYMRSLFIDIDCGPTKPYLNKQAGAEALDLFLQKSKLGLLGNPWIVSSGNGLHVYWPLEANVAIPVWRLAAENLKRLCKDYDLAIDFTVTADAARVLRVPGTSNWKDRAKPKAVKILYTGGTFKFADIEAALKAQLNGHALQENPVTAIPGTRPKRGKESKSHILVLENSVTKFSSIVKKSAGGDGCAQIEHYLSHAKDDGIEPLWRGILSLAKVCVDGEKAARKLSEMHPYTEERLQQKWREIKGPYPCTKLDGENPGICPGCKYWGKITNPLALGREVLTESTAKELVVPQAVDPKVTDAQFVKPEQIKITRPAPPQQFSYGVNGGVFRDVPSVDEQGAKVMRKVLVVPYDLFVIDLLNVNGEHYVYMLAMRPEGAVKVTLPQKAVVAKDDTVKVLASQNVVAAYGAGNDKNLFDYVRACVEEVSSSKHAVKVPASYGWQPDKGFVAGGKIFAADGAARQIPMPGLENITRGTTPSGALSEWVKFPQLFVAHKMYDIVALGCGIGFGSPLMEFSGLDGLVFHCGSTKSGTGKSLILELAATIWGHPRDYRVNKSTSPVAMQQHAGLLHNLPLISDEITTKNRKDFEWFPEFVFDIAEGRGKERMESGSNKERINLSTWSLIALMSSNTHAMDYLSGGRKHASEGEMRRLLEWTTEDVLSSWDAAAIETIKSTRTHHGVAGDKYAKWLACNRDKARDLYEAVYKRVQSEFEMSNDERYWHAGVAACISGCVLAGPQYANVVDLPIEPIIQSYRGIINKTRATIRINVRTAEDILNSYTRENFGRFVNVRAIDGALHATFGESGVVDESLTRTQIMGRVERNVTPGYVHYYVEERLLKAYCSTMSYGYADFRKELEKQYQVQYMKKDLLSRTKGPQMRVNAIMISRPESSLVETGGALPVD